MSYPFSVFVAGINYVIFFSKEIFVEAGASISSDVSVVIVGVVQFSTALVSSILVDRVGRRMLLLVSEFFMTLSLVAIGVFFHMKGTESVISAGWLPLVGLMIFFVAYSIGTCYT